MQPTVLLSPMWFPPSGSGRACCERLGVSWHAWRATYLRWFGSCCDRLCCSGSAREVKKLHRANGPFISVDRTLVNLDLGHRPKLCSSKYSSILSGSKGWEVIYCKGAVVVHQLPGESATIGESIMDVYTEEKGVWVNFNRPQCAGFFKEE